MAAAFQTALGQPANVAVPVKPGQVTIHLPTTALRKPASSARRRSLWLILGILVISIIGLLGLNYLGHQEMTTSSVALVSSPSISTMTPNVEKLAAATFAGRLTMTVSILSQTPDEQKTLIAVVGATDTANAMASFTATSTPTITPTATPTLATTLTPIQAAAYSIANYARVRTGPNLDNAILRELAQGDSLAVIAQAQVNSDLWYLVSVPNAVISTGWVLAKEVKIVPTNAAIVTAATVPPSPVPDTWTATPLPATPTPVGSSNGGSGNSSGSHTKNCTPSALPPPIGHGC